MQDYIIANLIGVFVIGFLIGIRASKKIKLILGFGFCGSLTTFSGWISYSSRLWIDESWFASINHILLLLLLGLAISFLGLLAGKGINHTRHLL